MIQDICKVRVRFAWGNSIKGSREVVAIIRDVWDVATSRWVKDVQTSRCHGYKVVTCYAHVGQHFEGEWEWAKSRPSVKSPSDWRKLLDELKDVGYDVTVLNKKGGRRG